jgi:hypothetical protein
MKIPFRVPNQVKKLLMNRYALYVVFAMALLQWLYLMSINRFDLLVVFGLIAIIIYKFNRNMILVLGIPFLIVLISSRLLKEGFEGETDNSGNNNKEKENKKTEDPQIVTPIENDPLPPDAGKSAENATDKSDAPEPHNQHETTEAASKNEEPEFDPNQINYASTLTQNMKSYNELLGSDGFAKMSQDTQLLLQQQEQLGNAMKQFAPLIGQMTPFLEKASGLLNNMDMKQINKVANVFKNQ